MLTAFTDPVVGFEDGPAVFNNDFVIVLASVAKSDVFAPHVCDSERPR